MSNPENSYIETPQDLKIREKSEKPKNSTTEQLSATDLVKNLEKNNVNLETKEQKKELLGLKLVNWLPINNHEDYNTLSKMLYIINGKGIKLPTFEQLRNYTVLSGENGLEIKNNWMIAWSIDSNWTIILWNPDAEFSNTDKKSTPLDIKNRITIKYVEWVKDPKKPTKEEILAILERNKENKQYKNDRSSVYALQVWLSLLQPDKNIWNIDWYYGIKTAETVNAYQKAHSVSLPDVGDWDAGDQTLALLWSELSTWTLVNDKETRERAEEETQDVLSRYAR